MAQDIYIGQAMTSPPPAWSVPVGSTGPFSLIVTVTNRPRLAPFIYRSDTGGLVLDGPEGVVTWPLTPAQAQALPSGPFTNYVLSDLSHPTPAVAAKGFVVVSDGVVYRDYPQGSSAPSAPVTSPVMEPGIPSIPIVVGPPGPSAYDVAVSDGFQGTSEQWLASLAVVAPDGIAYLAGADVNGHRALMVALGGAVVHADPTTATYLFVGVSLQAAPALSEVRVVCQGPITDPSWVWEPFMPVYAAPGGFLTQTVPDGGVLHQIGMASTSTTLVVSPQLPILLA